jgi:transcriptional regulator GlxA family with amidase domain
VDKAPSPPSAAHEASNGSTPRTPPAGDSRIVETVERAVLDALPTRLSEGALAKLAGVSLNGLQRAFLSERRTTLYSALHRLRLEEADRLLLEEPSSPAEAIAIRCGFGHYGVFHRNYRRHFGREPRADLRSVSPSDGPDAP